MDDAHALGLEVAQVGQRAGVGRAVVDDDELARLLVAHRGDGLPQGRAVVEARDDDSGARGHRAMVDDTVTVR